MSYEIREADWGARWAMGRIALPDGTFARVTRQGQGIGDDGQCYADLKDPTLTINQRSQRDRNVYPGDLCEVRLGWGESGVATPTIFSIFHIIWTGTAQPMVGADFGDLLTAYGVGPYEIAGSLPGFRRCTDKTLGISHVGMGNLSSGFPGGLARVPFFGRGHGRGVALSRRKAVYVTKLLAGGTGPMWAKWKLPGISSEFVDGDRLSDTAISTYERSLDGYLNRVVSRRGQRVGGILVVFNQSQWRRTGALWATRVTGHRCMTACNTVIDRVRVG